MRKVITVLRGAKSGMNSPSGNPSWTVFTDDGNWRTQRDAAVNYGIANITSGTGSWVDQKVILEVEGAGVIGVLNERTGERA